MTHLQFGLMTHGNFWTCSYSRRNYNCHVSTTFFSGEHNPWSCHLLKEHSFLEFCHVQMKMLANPHGTIKSILSWQKKFMTNLVYVSWQILVIDHGKYSSCTRAISVYISWKFSSCTMPIFILPMTTFNFLNHGNLVDAFSLSIMANSHHYGHLDKLTHIFSINACFRSMANSFLLQHGKITFLREHHKFSSQIMAKLVYGPCQFLFSEKNIKI